MFFQTFYAYSNTKQWTALAPLVLVLVQDSGRILTTGDCPMLRRFYVQKVLCSENICSKGSMFRRFYIQKVLCSEGPMFRRSYIQKVLFSEGPMFRKYLFKRSYIQKVLCSEGPIFRYIQKVLYSENSLFDVGKNLHLSVSGKLQCKITNHSLSF